MTASGARAAQDTLAMVATAGSKADRLRAGAIAAGFAWSILFVAVGVGCRLQTYGDGSIFAYAVAVQDAWAFHWRNIASRSFVYLFSIRPAEILVGATGDAAAGIALYGVLFFAAPLLGLAATWRADRSPGRIVLTAACVSTACLCPLVFGFPTEMWMAHALFWPTLAACHFAPPGAAGSAAVFALLLALSHTHEGALVFALAILATLALRGLRDPAFRRAAGAFAAVLAVWGAVKWLYPPDAYYAPILFRAAFYFIDVTALGDDLFRLLFAALALYLAAALLLRRSGAASPHAAAAAAVAALLAIYWLWFDRALHADHRYAARTALLIATPVLGGLAACFALRAEGRLALRVPMLPRLLDALAGRFSAGAAAGALALVTLIHAVETAKFVAAWTDYAAALRTLAGGADADPALGDPRFVSSARLAPALNRLSWNSTTPFLSVLVAPGFAPSRLVVDPGANYFWLTCAMARASEENPRALPRESRRLVRVHACLHR